MTHGPWLGGDLKLLRPRQEGRVAGLHRQRTDGPEDGGDLKTVELEPTNQGFLAA